MPTRVVITGIGCVSALGLGWDALWNGLCEGRSNLRPATKIDTSGFRSKLVGEVPDFKTQDYVPKSYRKAVKVMARDIELAVVAAKLAVQDAGLSTRGTLEGVESAKQTYPSARMGCHIGAGLIAAETEEMSAAMSTAAAPVPANADASGGSLQLDLKKWGGSGAEAGAGTGMEQLTPLWLLKYLPNMLACHVTIIHGCEGPSNTITCAEASGVLCVGESTRVIQRGAADLCFSGGVEAKVNPMGILRLDLAGWSAPTGEETDGARLAKPYDDSAEGGLVAEGGGVLVLESLATAQARGAKPYAEVVGVGGGTSDPFYSAGAEDEGFRYAILNALDDAEIAPDRIDAIVPMASGVECLDRAELGALRAVFGDRLAQIPLVSTMPNVGMCMAGSGALQVAVAAGCLKNQKLPARVHAGTPKSGLQIDPTTARDADLEYVLVCSGALGGQNAAVVLRRIRDE